MPFTFPKPAMRLAYLETGARGPGYFVLADDATDEPGDHQVHAQVRDPWVGMRFAATDQLLAVADAVLEMDGAIRDGKLSEEDWNTLAAAARVAVERARDTPPRNSRTERRMARKEAA
jgi:hypothetical protein